MTEEQWREVRRLLEAELPLDFTTGQTTVHWHEGIPMSVDVFKKGRRTREAVDETEGHEADSARR